MNHQYYIYVESDELDEMNRLLSLTKGTEDKDVIEVFSQRLQNLGHGCLEVDIKVCNGSEDSGPWIDAILFEDGSEILVLEPAFDQLDGEYIFPYNEDTITVLVRRLCPKVHIDINHNGNAGLGIEGYGDKTSPDNKGTPVYLEFDEDGKPRLYVWADINQEDPTHIIDLSGAKETNRITE